MAGDLVNIREFEELARQVLPKMHYDYFSGGAEDEHTLRENVESFQRITFRPRILADVSNVNLASSILGYNISAPILIAPTGAHKLAHPEGEVATARAAAACNTVMVLSFSSSCAIEEVASSCNAIRFYQLYVYRRRDVSATLVERAERNGFKAIVLTADTPRFGRRERDIRNKMVAPKLKNLEGLLSVEVDSGEGSKLEAFASQTMDPSLSWKDIEWLKSITKLPILIKGVLTAEDGKSTVFFATMSCFVTDFTGDALVRVSTMEEGTCLPWKKELVHGRAGKLVILSSDFAARMAVEVGAAGVIVSNHGGRQLDYSPASMSVLEEVVEAVKGRVPVIVDGGVRRGTDVFKALALGAQAVMIGRPVVYGLAAKGESGVRQVIEILKDELELTMALSGCCSVKDISRSCVQTERDRLRSLL